MAPWSGEPDGLIGRDDVLQQVRGLLDEGTRTAVVLGIPGAGKSAVLEFAARAARAEGRLVLQIVGHATDTDLAFVGLLDLLSVPTPSAEATSLARDVAERIAPADGRPPPHPLRLRLDLLGWLEELAAHAPVLLVVDDAQWVDRSTLSVLAFVAHRLASSQVALLLAARTEAPPAGFDAHPVVPLPPLDQVQAAALLRRAGVELTAFVRSSVIERSAGNPLALLELGRAAAAGAEAAGGVAEALRPPQRLPTSVEAAFAAELPALPAATRQALLLVAAGGDDLGVLGRIVEPDELVADLRPAEHTGLVRIQDRRVRFRHPLARAAVYSTAPTADRVGAHRHLAAAYSDDPDRQVWHRAEATLVPDEDVAQALVAAAERARDRGAGSEAARAMTRAADLSPDRRQRDERLLQALSLALPTGHVHGLAELATEVRERTDDAATRARASHYIAYALAQTMRQDEARRALLDALEQAPHAGEDFGWGSLTTLASLAYQSGRDADLVRVWSDRFRREAPEPPAVLRELVTAAEAWVRASVDPLARPDDLARLVRDSPALDATHPPDVVSSQEMLLGAAAWLLDEPRVALRRLTKALDIMERTHAPGQQVQTLTARAQVQFDLGLIDEADDAGRMLIDFAEAENLAYTADVGRELRARAAGLRGDLPAAKGLVDGVLVGLEVGQCLALECNLRVAMSYAVADDPAACFDQLRGLFTADGGPVHAHVSYRHLADLVSAAVRAGRAAEVVAIVELAGPRLVGVRHRQILARARALLAGDDAEPLFEEAVGDPLAEQWPFELASARLDYGAWLRRRRRSVAARDHLAAALETFQRLRARHWADLARVELRAAGVTAGPRSSAWDELTAQERHVVRLAATGMTNREIGASLYLSPRTVSAHLYNAFPKLGVTARSQLRDVVEARGTD